MLQFFSSLSFLYLFCIIVLLVYGFVYWQQFQQKGYVRKIFPYVFPLIAVACLAFLWINMRAPLSLKTISNLDHHFIRHDGFAVTQQLEIGKTDTANMPGAAYNRFAFYKDGGQLAVQSSYSEDPFYISAGGSYRLASVKYEAQGHPVSLRAGNREIVFTAPGDNVFELKIGETGFRREMKLRRGATAWDIMSEADGFSRSPFYNDITTRQALKQLFVVRDAVTKRSGEGLFYFFSGKIFDYVSSLRYDGQPVTGASLSFNKKLDAKEPVVAWGIGFLENNRNQYKIKNGAADSFYVQPRYPVSYPLTEENRDQWKKKHISKFLLADAKDMQQVPAVFREGFLFAAYSGDSALAFAPLLLTYQKDEAGKTVNLQPRNFAGDMVKAGFQKGQLVLPASVKGVSWLFTIKDTYDWEFGSRQLSPAAWGGWIAGAMGLFFLLVMVVAIVRPADQQSWVWQVLSAVVFILLTTRYFLYWRYKSFPPYEGMDLPSQQQLMSAGNFFIIIAATVLLALLFGSSAIRYGYIALRRRVARISGRYYHGAYHVYDGDEQLPAERRLNQLLGKVPVSGKTIFFTGWAALLIAGGTLAAASGFDPGTCRHLAIGLVLAYFIFLFISYRHSPLVAATGKAWWKLSTGSVSNILVNNPVKVLLSVSLMALFAFVDIGFAIVFLNFLLFNEAFLCINYTIAGLSAGSNRNARLFGIAGAVYILAFVLNLLYAPYIFKFLLDLPQFLYAGAYILFAVSISYVVMRLLTDMAVRRRKLAGIGIAAGLFAIAFLFFPKERILSKAAVTRYRIDVLTMPADKAITSAYKEGKTYEPVIRAAQNQWFINTFIHEENNPAAKQTGFHLLPHAPQNKGAKYNAQATDLVASRFLVAEHGMTSVLLYALLLLLPVVMLASFYKLYPDFTNRTNTSYPAVTAGFSLLNYLLITALLVILAATGRYIFFGQDLPFGSILSKQSVLFPALLITIVVLFFHKIPLQQYANRKKILPGLIVFGLLAVLLFVVKPVFNKNREFGVDNLAAEMDSYVQAHLQPVLQYFDTAAATRRLTLAKKDELFTDSLRNMLRAGMGAGDNPFFLNEMNAYAHAGFARHTDQRRMLFLSTSQGSPQLAVNENYFRVEPPPHLQQVWTGNVFGDTTTYNISFWDANAGTVINHRLSSYTWEPDRPLSQDWKLSFRNPGTERFYTALYLVNQSGREWQAEQEGRLISLRQGDSLLLQNPSRLLLTDSRSGRQQTLLAEPDAFMKNYYVNGSRYYTYPLAERFIWARNFAEAIAADYTRADNKAKDAVISLNYEMMDSLTAMIRSMMDADNSYEKGAEYAVCIADGNGRLIAMADFIKGMERPDPNQKAAFNRTLSGDDGFVSQSLLRKQIGNLNLLRMNPGPGSTFKPVAFSAIASQLSLDWEHFSSAGFSEKLTVFGGERVPEYDFEVNNGRISRVTDYLRYSDNYYHANVLLLGSYPKQPLQGMLQSSFVKRNPGSGLSWPYFDYKNTTYWLPGFKQWPGYESGRANFGLDSSFTSVGLNQNFGIATRPSGLSFERFGSAYDSALFLSGWKKSGFILPEYSLFDQYGEWVNHRVPYDLFVNCFRGHVKGSSQVMVSPAKMTEAFGRLISQNRNYALTLNPYVSEPVFSPFYVDESLRYNSYLSLIRDGVMTGMREAVAAGTAGTLGRMLSSGAPYYYYGKTGTTGDDQKNSKSKLFSLLISSADVTSPDHNFRHNRFYSVYFMSQNGPAKQNEAFQARVVKFLESSPLFTRYMKTGQ